MKRSRHSRPPAPHVPLRGHLAADGEEVDHDRCAGVPQDPDDVGRAAGRLMDHLGKLAAQP
ncbi:MAG: hypothetical protein V3T23_04940, partial [Nitrososphaerales archaeon]